MYVASVQVTPGTLLFSCCRHSVGAIEYSTYAQSNQYQLCVEASLYVTYTVSNFVREKNGGCLAILSDLFLKMIRTNYTFLLIFSIICIVNGGNILLLHSFFIGSHIISLRNIAKICVDLGHKVTIVRYLEKGSPGPLELEGVTELILTINNTNGYIPYVTKEQHGRFELPSDHVWKYGLTTKLVAYEAYTTVTSYCDDMLRRKDLFEYLQASNFSIAIVDLLFNECSLAFAHNLRTPIVGYWAFQFASGPALYTSGLNPPSTIPQVMSGYSDEMSFVKRLANTVQSLILNCFMQIQMFHVNTVVQMHFPDTPYPDKLLAELSGVLIDSHPALAYPLSLPYTFRQIGGLSMKSTQPLPKNIQTFLDDSGKVGVILFSLGHSFDAKAMPANIFENYFRAFARLKQKVLVKAGAPPPFNISTNIKIASYLPQADILAHEKVVLFITHGGMKGILESVYNNVPMVVLPIFTDQKDNANMVENLGIGIHVNKEATANSLVTAANTVLDNNMYQEAVNRYSRILRHHKDPAEEVQSFVKLMLETKGAEHMKHGSRYLNVFQYLCIDVFLCISSIVVVLMYSAYSIYAHSYRPDNTASIFMKKNL